MMPSPKPPASAPPPPPSLPSLPGPWRTAKDLARYSGFSVEWIYKRARRAVDPLPFRRVGRTYRFSLRLFDEWLARQTPEA